MSENEYTLDRELDTNTETSLKRNQRVPGFIPLADKTQKVFW